MIRTGLLAMALVAFLSGCASPSHYYWGHYEDVIYTRYSDPGKVPPEKQAALLEEDYQKAKAANKPVPPGFHAHLGYLYCEMGKPDQGRAQFEAEKADFPESAVFMDRLIANLTKK